jgi:peptidoglycan hydrolase CwlO-like protein
MIAEDELIGDFQDMERQIDAMSDIIEENKKELKEKDKELEENKKELEDALEKIRRLEEEKINKIK